MYSKYAELISLLLIAAYIYTRIKDKIALYVLGCIIYLAGCFAIFHVIYPDVPLHSPTCEYMGFLFFVGLGFLVTIVLIGIEMEKRKNANTEKKENLKSISSILDLSKENIIFWTIIVLINLVAFLLGGQK